jgi:Kef-type K+ transport system membrane component KefB
VWIVAKAIVFLGVAVGIGRWVSRRTFALAARLRGEGVLLSVAIAFCFVLAWIAGRVGLAPIVGAFAAGLVLDEDHYRDCARATPKRRTLQSCSSRSRRSWCRCSSC